MSGERWSNDSPWQRGTPAGSGWADPADTDPSQIARPHAPRGWDGPQMSNSFTGPDEPTIFSARADTPTLPSSAFNAPTVADLPTGDPWWPPSPMPARAGKALGGRMRRAGLGRRLLLVASLAVLAALAVAAVAAALSQTSSQAGQSPAPVRAAQQFCDALRTQRYDTAYGLLSTRLRAHLSLQQLAVDARTLDSAEGAVTACDAASGGSGYRVGVQSATITTRLSRRIQGTLTGAVPLVNEHGVWRVDGLPVSLVGTSLDALHAAEDFCGALQARDYTKAYAAIAGTGAGVGTGADFASATATWERLDGPVTACAVGGVGNGADEVQTALTLRITRTKGSPYTGVTTWTLRDDRAWRITSLDATALGTDLGPLATGKRFCDAVHAGDYTGAYRLFASAYRAQVSQQQFESNLGKGLFNWTCGAPQLDTYTVTGATAEYALDARLSAIGGLITTSKHVRLFFVKENGRWMMLGLQSQ